MRYPFAIGAAVALLVHTGAFDIAGAQSQPESKSGGSVDAADEVVSKVSKSANPKATYESLSPKEKEAFNARIKSATNTFEVEKVEEEKPTAAGACWKGQARGSGKNSVGGTLYTYWVEGTWCASGNRVTSTSFTRADGETKTPGWRYAGVKSKGDEVASNRGRVWAKHRFILGIGGWDIQTVDVCLRFSGEPNGKITAQGTCGAF